MKELRVFKNIVILLVSGTVLMVVHGIWSKISHTPSTQMRSLTTLGGNPFENSTLYFRYFELSDYMSGHFYYPGAPLLGHESYTYKVLHHEP
ncbi:MAG: hypothetical protein IBX45_12215 [Campylobacterales bacterium]|nr:hypothetical protein [Campylobacterales bacterium]